jgi:hypothetical protein
MRKKIAIGITFIVGLYYFLEFVLPGSVGGGFDCRRMGSPCMVATDDGYRLYYTGVRALKGSTDMRLAIGLAESSDGTAWDKADANPLLAPSLFSSKDWRGPDDPAVVVEPDGTYTMYYVGHGADGSDRIMRSTSDDGRHWRGRRVVLSLIEETAGLGERAERASITALAVRRTDAGYAAYFASTYRRGERTIQGVSLATSADGLEWTLDDATNPVLPIEPESGWSYTTITDLSLVDNGEWLSLYYVGTRRIFRPGSDRAIDISLIGLATSSDGLAWQRNQGNPIFGPAMWRVLKSLRDDPGVGQVLERFRAIDTSVAWTRRISLAISASFALSRELREGTALEQAASQLSEQEDPKPLTERFDALSLSAVSVERAGDGYVMAYCGAPSAEGEEPRLGTAVSRDGVVWRTTSGTPALELGDEPQSTYLTSSLTTVSQVFIVVGAMALGLGLFGLVRLHGTRIVKGEKDSVYSMAFFVALVPTLVLAFGWGQREPKFLEAGHKLYNIIFRGLITSFGASSMGLLTFYLASASYRSFKLKNAEAGLMMAAAVLVMLGQVPLGQLLTAWLPPGAQIQNVTYWINYTIMVPTMRAIEIGAAVGGLVLATRLWLSMDKRRL